MSFSLENIQIKNSVGQTYLENDYLPTFFGSTVTWNGYSGGVDISFNFTYEIN